MHKMYSFFFLFFGTFIKQVLLEKGVIWGARRCVNVWRVFSDSPKLCHLCNSLYNLILVQDTHRQCNTYNTNNIEINSQLREGTQVVHKHLQLV